MRLRFKIAVDVAVSWNQVPYSAPSALDAMMHQQVWLILNALSSTLKEICQKFCSEDCNKLQLILCMSFGGSGE